MKTKLLALLCALTLLAGAVPAAAALEGEAIRAADILTTLHVLTDDTYDLEQPATRRQAAALAVDLSGGKWAARAYTQRSAFRDVPAADTAIHYGAAQGWFTGISETSFQPDAPISANAWCTFLLRMVGYRDKDGEFAVSDAARFAHHIGLLTRTHTGTLTRADLFESAVEILTFTCKDGKTVIDRLIASGTCTRAAANALGLLTESLTARQIADRHTAAVFCLNGYNTDQSYIDKDPSHEASGFFITADGVAVTNYHSISGATHAHAVLPTGEVFPVESILWYDAKIDLAVLKISREPVEGPRVSAFAYLEMHGTNDLRAGDIVYTLGNPLALGLAVSSGIVSDPSRPVERYAQPCIMNTADISSGSSGGALMNIYGHVVGVTTGAFSYGNSMYLAVPIDPVLDLDLTVPGMSMRDVATAESQKTAS